MQIFARLLLVCRTISDSSSGSASASGIGKQAGKHRPLPHELATPIAQDQVLGSGAALAIGFPLLIVINMPLAWYGGQLEGYAVVTGLLGAYLLITFGLWSLFQRKVSALSANPGPE